MTPKQLRAFMVDNSLTGSLMGKMCAVADGRTVRRWLAGESDIPGPVLQLVRLLDTLKPTQRAIAIAMLIREFEADSD